MLARWRSFVIVAALAAIAAFLLAWWMFRPKPAVVEVNAPAVRQSDGSEVAKKEVVKTPPPRPHVLPAGSRVLRAEEITVTPSSDHLGEEVHVDATLVETKDGQTHLITSSPQGTTTATDIVVQDTRKPLELPQHHLTVLYGGRDYFASYSQKLIGPIDWTVAVKIDPTGHEKLRGYVGGTLHW